MKLVKSHNELILSPGSTGEMEALELIFKALTFHNGIDSTIMIEYLKVDLDGIQADVKVKFGTDRRKNG